MVNPYTMQQNPMMQSQQPRGVLEWLASPQAAGMAQGLLAASAPSRTPVGFGQALGMGMQGAQAAHKEARSTQMDDLKLQVLLQEIEQKRKQQETLSGLLGGGTPDAEKLALAGMIGDDANMLGYAKFLQDRQLKEKELKDGKLPSGFSWGDDGTAQRIPGTSTPEQAGKMAGVTNAKSALAEVKTMLFDASGKVNMSRLLGAYTNAPGTEGRQVRNLMKNAIEAQLRAESGAAVPESEVERALDRFLPSPFDNRDTKLQKIEQLQNLVNLSLEGSGAAIGGAASSPDVNSDPLGIR